ncbi:hypothetical protein Z052_02000 [Halorubrum sp. C191]|uniref:YccF domain-containing protein n=1 Tax=Halorubrum sp. C191 TaxID=1383842 RepID=UPI000C075499|nr:YccF domain-containing protein [Halorubrum sp. C191]PHQ43936.1 hypothetical protein Z052_02000 [Halorubrum sp. C191]
MALVKRLVWFLTLGWVFGLVWAVMSIALMASIVGFPFGMRALPYAWPIATLRTAPDEAIRNALNGDEDKSNTAAS